MGLHRAATYRSDLVERSDPDRDPAGKRGGGDLSAILANWISGRRAINHILGADHAFGRGKCRVLGMENSKWCVTQSKTN